MTVRQMPTEIKTKMSWYPNDFATVTSHVLGDNLPNGRVDFYLVNNATCTRGANDANLLYAETLSKTAGTHSYDASTSNYPGGAGTLPADVDSSFGVWHAFKVTTDFTDAADSVKGDYSWLAVYTPSDTAHIGRQSACTTGSTEKFKVTYTNDPGTGTQP